MSLDPEQREHLQRLLEDRLRAAGRAAAERGVAPAAIADLLEERRAALRELLPADDDRQDVSHDLVDGFRVGESS